MSATACTEVPHHCGSAAQSGPSRFLILFLKASLTESIIPKPFLGLPFSNADVTLSLFYSEGKADTVNVDSSLSRFGVGGNW